MPRALRSLPLPAAVFTELLELTRTGREHWVSCLRPGPSPCALDGSNAQAASVPLPTWDYLQRAARDGHQGCVWQSPAGRWWDTQTGSRTHGQGAEAAPHQIGDDVISLLLQPHEDARGVQAAAVGQHHGALAGHHVWRERRGNSRLSVACRGDPGPGSSQSNARGSL